MYCHLTICGSCSVDNDLPYSTAKTFEIEDRKEFTGSDLQNVVEDFVYSSFNSYDKEVNKMRTNSEKLIAIDSLHNNGAGWKVLGVLNYRVPNLGIVFSWPSVKKSKQLLQKALKYFPNDIPNNFFYAEALMENKEKEMAKVYTIIY